MKSKYKSKKPPQVEKNSFSEPKKPESGDECHYKWLAYMRDHFSPTEIEMFTKVQSQEGFIEFIRTKYPMPDQVFAKISGPAPGC